MKRLYELVLEIEFDGPVNMDDLDDAIGNVVEWSTAREALETGLDAEGEGRITLQSFRVIAPVEDPRDHRWL